MREGALHQATYILIAWSRLSNSATLGNQTKVICAWTTAIHIHDKRRPKGGGASTRSVEKGKPYAPWLTIVWPRVDFEQICAKFCVDALAVRYDAQMHSEDARRPVCEPKVEPAADLIRIPGANLDTVVRDAQEAGQVQPAARWSCMRRSCSQTSGCRSRALIEG
jgi:hypothetical protein